MKKPKDMRRGDEVITREKLIPFFEDVKDLIRSSAKATETGLEKKLGGRLDTLDNRMASVEQDVSSLKGDVVSLKGDVSSLKNEMKQTQAAVLENGGSIKELKGDVSSLKNEMKQTQAAVLENGRSIKELKTEMHQMEERLANKIDRNAIRLDDHETRISELESTR